MKPFTGEGDLFEISQVILSSEAGHFDDVDRALATEQFCLRALE
jgi:hypothetical protein